MSELHCPAYTEKVFRPEEFERLVKQTVKAIKGLKIPIHAVAGCGMSGIPLASAVALSLKTSMLLVRKAGDPGHDDRHVNGTFTENGNYVIVDDMIDTGETMRNILREIRRCGKKMTCKAILLYRDRSLQYNAKTNNYEAIFDGIPTIFID